MDQVLLSQPGRVAVLPEPVALPTVIRVAGFAPARAIITSISYSQDVAAQFLTTLQNVIYVYSIGDNIGTVMVTGVAFSSKCNDVRNAHGISDIFKEYDKLKLLANPRTIAITIGDKAFLGLLMGIQVSTGDVQFGLMNYTLAFRILPEETHLRTSQKQEPDYGKTAEETPKEIKERESENPPKKEEDVDSSKDIQNNSENNPNSTSSPSGSNSFVEDWRNNINDAVNYVKEGAASIPDIINSVFSPSKNDQAGGAVVKAVVPTSVRPTLQERYGAGAIEASYGGANNERSGITGQVYEKDTVGYFLHNDKRTVDELEEAFFKDMTTGVKFDG